MDDDEEERRLLTRLPLECLGFQARIAARRLTRYYNRWFRPLELTAEQFSLLVGIATIASSNVGTLAGCAGADATTVSRNVKNLEGRRLVRSTGGRGRGGKLLALTPEGNALLRAALPRWQAARDELARRLGEDAARYAIKSMSSLAEAASSDKSPEPGSGA